MNTKIILKSCITALVLFFALPVLAKTTKSENSVKYYGSALCNTPDYDCIKIKKGDSWKKLFPDEQQRDIVQRVNRTNMYLRPGQEIAVPVDLANKTIHDVAPFPRQINPSDNQLIIVDQDKLAWVAYDRKGNLIKWGAISSGKDYCSDIKGSCNTITGEFYVFNKKDKRCRSTIYPVGRGGSHMPYCMFFYKGYALHGSDEVPGYRASHGCVRLFTEDALWLNNEFVEIPNREGTIQGTKVVIQKLTGGE